MTTIYLIDDDYRRHKKLSLLVSKLNSSNSSGEYQCAPCPEIEADAREHARNSIKPENVWRAVSTADTDSIFLIDLTLTGLEENQAREDLLELLTTSSFGWKDTAIEAFMKQESDGDWSCKTALFACAVLHSRGISTIIVSTAASVAEVKRFRNKFLIEAASLEDFDCISGCNTSTRISEPSDLEREILKLRRHSDPIIRAILASYSQPLSTSSSYWTHGLEESFDPRQVGKGVWGLDSITDTDNKSMHCRGANWTIRAPGSLSPDVLEVALKNLKFECPTVLEGLSNSHFYFPLQPGIVFLLSLRELVVSMTVDHSPEKVRPRPSELKLGRSGRVMFVSIKLAPRAGNDFAIVKSILSKNWKTHDGAMRDRLPEGGLSEAIFHLGHARLDGIKGKEPWALLFKEGSRDWCAWPSFQESSITFHWHIG